MRLCFPLSIHLTLLLVLVLPLSTAEFAEERKWKPPEPLADGWSGAIEFGGQRLGGNTRSSSTTAGAGIAWARGRLERELASEFLTSTVSLVTSQRNTEGNPLVDDSGRTRLDVTRGRSHERLAAVAPVRWLWTERGCQFVPPGLTSRTFTSLIEVKSADPYPRTVSTD